MYRRLGMAVLCCCYAATAGSLHASAAESQWITTGATGRLVYVPDAEGDRILDFSNVGYRGRGTALIPEDVPNVVTLSPELGDDTARIQAAIQATKIKQKQPQKHGPYFFVSLNLGVFGCNFGVFLRNLRVFWCMICLIC